ncbi:MAG: DUF2235 domain-containing protein [Comamonadaceae bacterium]|nr:DUF2235 domain-containing protein [Comamonadaceae bacterium]
MPPRQTPAGRARSCAAARTRIERGFLGAHADIGGGFGENDSQLARAALVWMVEQAQVAGVTMHAPHRPSSQPGSPRQKQQHSDGSTCPGIGRQASALSRRRAQFGSDAGQGPDQQRRFRGIALVLVVDAIPGAEMEGLVFYNDRGTSIYASSIVAKGNRSIMALGSPRAPLTVRVIWRGHPKAIWGQHGGIDCEGPILGDHTIPVAARIPDEVLRDIRSQAGRPSQRAATVL